jgi:PKD repeat protein
VFAVVLLLVIGAGCDSPSTIVGVDNGAPDLTNVTLEIVSGDQQQNEVASVLPEPLVVEAVDPNGSPVSGVSVHWVFSQGRGRSRQNGQGLDTIETVTDADGRAQTWWELGTRAGTQSASAEIPETDTAVQQSSGPSGAPKLERGKKVGLLARARPSSPDSISFTPESLSLSPGDSAQLVASVFDRYGNSLTGTTVDWASTDTSVAVTSNDGEVYATGSGTALVTAASGGAEAETDVTVLSTTNQAPTAAITSPVLDVAIAEGESVDFQGSASDPDGTVTSHHWDLGDGTTTSAADPGVHVYATAGTYQVSYYAQDDDGSVSETQTRTVTVTAAGTNQAPTATITSPIGDVSIAEGESVDFQGSASDPDGIVTSHHWDLGDGTTMSVADPAVHVYATAGTYQVSYYAQDDDGWVSETQARTVTVTATTSQDPPAGGVYMWTDWSTATGGSSTAIRDAGKARPWTGLEGNATAGAFEVLSTAGTGRDYPTTNFLRLRAMDSPYQDGWAFLTYVGADRYIPQVQVGDSVFVRYYFRNTINATASSLDNDTHGNEWGPGGNPVYPYNVTEFSGVSGYRLQFYPNTGVQYGIGSGLPLSKNVTYRIEHGIVRTGATTYVIRARVYDVTGRLVHASQDFDRRGWDGQAGTLADTEFTGDDRTWSGVTNFRIGLNGLAGLTSANEHDVFEYAGFAVCSSWCGAYNASGTEN